MPSHEHWPSRIKINDWNVVKSIWQYQFIIYTLSVSFEGQSSEIDSVKSVGLPSDMRIILGWIWKLPITYEWPETYSFFIKKGILWHNFRQNIVNIQWHPLTSRFKLSRDRYIATVNGEGPPISPLSEKKSVGLLIVC